MPGDPTLLAADIHDTLLNAGDFLRRTAQRAIVEAKLQPAVRQAAFRIGTVARRSADLKFIPRIVALSESRRPPDRPKASLTSDGATPDDYYPPGARRRDEAGSDRSCARTSTRPVAPAELCSWSQLRTSRLDTQRYAVAEASLMQLRPTGRCAPRARLRELQGPVRNQELLRLHLAVSKMNKARVLSRRGLRWTCASTSGLGFLFCLCGSCFLLRWIFRAGLSKRARVQAFRASCAGHPYPFASSLFCAIHSSAASMSDSCAAVMPGMRPPPASCLTRASSVDDTVLTQVSPRRTLEVNFWDFLLRSCRLLNQPNPHCGPKHSAANDICARTFARAADPGDSRFMGYLIERNSRCLIDIVELFASRDPRKADRSGIHLFSTVPEMAAVAAPRSVGS